MPCARGFVVSQKGRGATGARVPEGGGYAPQALAIPFLLYGTCERPPPACESGGGRSCFPDPSRPVHRRTPEGVPRRGRSLVGERTVSSVQPMPSEGTARPSYHRTTVLRPLSTTRDAKSGDLLAQPWRCQNLLGADRRFPGRVKTDPGPLGGAESVLVLPF